MHSSREESSNHCALKAQQVPYWWICCFSFSFTILKVFVCVHIHVCRRTFMWNACVRRLVLLLDTFYNSSLTFFFPDLFSLCSWVFSCTYVCSLHGSLASAETGRELQILRNWSYRRLLTNMWMLRTVSSIRIASAQPWIISSAPPPSSFETSLTLNLHLTDHLDRWSNKFHRLPFLFSITRIIDVWCYPWLFMWLLDM